MSETKDIILFTSGLGLAVIAAAGAPLVLLGGLWLVLVPALFCVGITILLVWAKRDTQG